MNKSEFIKLFKRLPGKGWRMMTNERNNKKRTAGQGIIQLAPPGKKKHTYSPVRAVCSLTTSEMWSAGGEEAAFRELGINGGTKSLIETATRGGSPYFLTEDAIELRREMFEAFGSSCNSTASSKRSFP